MEHRADGAARPGSLSDYVRFCIGRGSLRYPLLRFVSRMTIHCSDRSRQRVLSEQGGLLLRSETIWAHAPVFELAAHLVNKLRKTWMVRHVCGILDKSSFQAHSEPVCPVVYSIAQA